MACQSCANISIFATQALPCEEGVSPSGVSPSGVSPSGVSPSGCSCLLDEKKIAIQLDRYTKPAFSISPITGSTPSLKILLRGKEDILLPKTVKGIISSACSERDALSRMVENMTSCSMKGVTVVCDSMKESPRFSRRSDSKPLVLHIGCGAMLVTKKISELLGSETFGIDFIDRSPRGTLPSEYEWLDIESIPKISSLPEGGLKNIPISFPSATGTPTEGPTNYGPGDSPSFFAETPLQSLDAIFITDILHHILHFCGLVKWCELALKKGGYLVIQDLDCCSWEDAYILDAQHRCFFEIESEARIEGLEEKRYCLPVYSYQKRSFWREFLSVQGFQLVKTYDHVDEYRGYTDLYVKK